MSPIEISGWVVLAVVGAFLLLWLGIAASTMRSRLRRLAARVDRSGKALEHALDERAAVAVRVAEAGPAASSTPDPAADAVAGLADAARRALAAGPEEREAAENDLAARLARVIGGRRSPLTEELGDSQIRVTMARRFYNDAVRDTRTLLGRRIVRLFGLGKGIAAPEYFEISERTAPATAGTARSA